MSEKLISWLKVNGYDMKNIWWGGGKAIPFLTSCEGNHSYLYS